MTTILFVHGTGVREPHDLAAFAEVSKAIRGRWPEILVQPCYWGREHGASLHSGGKSVPEYAKTLAVDAVEDDDYLFALWSLLAMDPFFELRSLATETGHSEAFVPGVRTAGDELDTRFLDLVPIGPLRNALADAGLELDFDDARQNLVGSAAYQDALSVASELAAPLRTAVARATIAEAMSRCERRGEFPPAFGDAALRNNAIRLLAAELGLPDLGLQGWAVRQLFGLALKLGVMDPFERKRGAITNAVYPGAGDVLLYQGRGGPIRNFIEQRIQEASPPVVVLAHSLGGVASVDLLIMTELPNVKLLITVGCQAPFLYEIGALHSLQHGEPLPTHFPPWLNIYDPRDLLSYIGEPLFLGRLTDVAVDSKLPFPRSHSAYWGNPATWNAIEARLP